MTKTLDTPETESGVDFKDEPQTIIKCGYFDDGIVFPGTVVESPLTPEVNFKYRPMIEDDWDRYADLAEKAKASKNNKALREVTYAMICEFVVDWDVMRRVSDGSIVKVDLKKMDQVRRVSSHILRNIENVILESNRVFGEELKKSEPQSNS